MYIKPSTILAWGIVAAALSSLGIPGIIVGSIARNKVNAYTMTHDEPSGMVKTGSALSKVGLIGGTVVTIVFFLLLLFDLR